MVAAFHKQGQDLVHIYKKILKEEELIDNSSNYSHNGFTAHKNLMSLRLSTDASIKLLTESLPMTKDLLHFLSCLPDGIKRSHLMKLFDAEKVQEAIDAMLGYNQLDL